MTGPLAGVRVVDLTSTFMGPYCTLQLARMGADVVKVEPPEGDIVRRIGANRNPGMGPIFLNSNAGKRSIAVDLKQSAGVEVLHRMLADADVFVTNMRPDAVDRLGLAFDGDRYPRLVYATLPGFGSTGPYRDHAAYDDVIQAISGVAATQGGGGPPDYVRTPVADKVVALLGLSAILAALVARGRTGRGQAVEIPMFESMVDFMLLDQQGGHVFDPPLGPTGYARTSSPNRRPYRTADGYLGVMVYTDRQWLAFFDLIGRPELRDDPRFCTITARTDHIDELYGIVAEVLPGRTNAEWLADLQTLGVPCTPVKSMADVFDDEHLRAVGLFDRVEHPTEGALVQSRLPVVFGDAPGDPRPAPRLGEHGVEVLRSLGYDEDRIRDLVDTSVVRLTEGEQTAVTLNP